MIRLKDLIEAAAAAAAMNTKLGYVWEYKENEEWLASFRVPDKDLKYLVSFIKSGAPFRIPYRNKEHKDIVKHGYELSFSAEDLQGNTLYSVNVVDKIIPIMSTILKILQEFAKKKSPKYITFSTKEAQRYKQYSRFVDNISKHLKNYDFFFEYKDPQMPGEVIFVLRKKGVAKTVIDKLKGRLE